MNLMRFGIPSHWWIMKNDFFDIEPFVDGEGALPRGYFIEDILSMELRRPTESATFRPAEYLVDLGWYPDQDPSGAYSLVLLGRGWDDTLVKFKSRDRFAVRDTLERWLSQIHRASDRAQLERWLEKDSASQPTE